MAFPGNVSYTKVTGRFLRAVTDSIADPDNFPDSDPLEGLSVVFTPSLAPARVKNVTANPPLTIIIDPVTVTTDVEGDIASPSGEKGVWLVSSDDPDLDPHGWTYTVRISGLGFTQVEFAFVAVSGATLDIATMVPVPVNPGAALLEWQAAVAETDANADRAEAAADEAEAIVASIPTIEGPPGEDGEDGAPGDPGAPGPAGPSAYEVAVSEGFVGDEAAWLASLQGEDGEQGPPGSGLIAYANWAAVDAVTQTEMGAVTGSLADLATGFPTATVATDTGTVIVQTNRYESTAENIITLQQATTLVDAGTQQTYPIVRVRYESPIGSGWQAWTPWYSGLPFASTSDFGAARYASTAEAQAMSSNARVITPSTLASASASAATALRIVRRDSAGRAKVATPAAGDDIATKDYADSVGLVPYANLAAIDAVTVGQLGTVSPATTWGAYLGPSSLNSYTGKALVSTVAGTRSAASELTQTLNIGRHSNGYDVIYSRTKFGAGAWTAWVAGAPVPTPTQSYHATTKLYVDSVALTRIAWADLDGLPGNHGRTGFVTVTGDNLGTLTGISKYNDWPGGELRFESHGSYITADYYSAQVQRVWIPNLDGTVDEIRRNRSDEPSWTMSAWSAWAIVTEEATFGRAGTLATVTGAGRLYNRSGSPRQIQRVGISVGTAPTGASIIVDIHKGGTTIFTTQSNRPTIAVSTNEAVSGRPEVFTWAEGEYITIDIDQIGSTVAGSDLSVSVYYS